MSFTFASLCIIIRFKLFNQQDAAVLQVYYLTFMCGSTCFGRLLAHHQEHTTALEASGFTVGEKRLERCWSRSGRPLQQKWVWFSQVRASSSYDSNNTTKKMQQFHKFIIWRFMCGSTCFGRLLAHHQEHTTALGASGFTVWEKRLECCWSWWARRHPKRVSPYSANVEYRVSS
jgi:hypothetical protein